MILELNMTSCTAEGVRILHGWIIYYSILSLEQNPTNNFTIATKQRGAFDSCLFRFAGNVPFVTLPTYIKFLSDFGHQNSN